MCESHCIVMETNEFLTQQKSGTKVLRKFVSMQHFKMESNVNGVKNSFYL